MAIDRQRIYHKRDRLRQLRAFCRAARLESFAGAALQLDVSPPAVSTHVRELEHELELRLFDRSGSRVSLTSAGEALYALAEPLVEGMDALPNILIENINGSDSGWFELAATAVAASFVLPSCLKRFRDRHPGIRVRVRNCLFREGIRFVLDEDVEFLLGAKDDYPQESVEYQELLTYAMVLITPLDHPLAGRDTVPLEETVQWPAVVPPTGFYTREIEEAYQTSLEECAVECNIAVEVRGWEGIKRYVERGFGIATIPSICVGETDRLSVVSLPDSFPRLGFGVFTRRDRILDPIVRRFLRFMRLDFPSFAARAPHAR